MVRNLALVFLGALLSTSAVYAATDKAESDPNEVICKMEKRTGTRFATKICHTRAEWAEMAEASKRAYSEQRDRPVVSIARDE